MQFLKVMLLVAVVCFIFNFEGALSDNCDSVKCSEPTNCRKGTFRLKNQCCDKCKGEYVCPANLECKTITCKQDDDCDRGKKCCDCVGAGTVCSKVTGNADSDETNSEDTESDSKKTVSYENTNL
ncbi:uncharacterized protein LOC132758802 [Ruditapes philippinarum]|uniref:uncharacterized protein LOC132758802 n=1 Tax=Ruditapes philippinarum TaxID=129788 RepID=UPI00295AF8D1|nr:uncharacterized protein LOC132758802 [Ruditapes philippinarum]XP_060606485.1 uncharacterized protein LOC132758802 [Ruditapes philippinarum]